MMIKDNRHYSGGGVPGSAVGNALRTAYPESPRKSGTTGSGHYSGD